MAQHGGKRAGAGRKPGKVGQAKRDLAALAKDHAESALKSLVEIARTGASEAARVSAAVAILDRAYGKPVPMPEAPEGDAAPGMSITINSAAPVGDIRVTRSDC